MIDFRDQLPTLRRADRGPGTYFQQRSHCHGSPLLRTFTKGIQRVLCVLDIISGVGMGFFGMDIDRALDQARELDALRQELMEIRGRMSAIAASAADSTPDLLSLQRQAAERDQQLGDYAAFLEGWSRALRDNANQLRMTSSW